MDVRLEALESEEAVDLLEFVDSIDEMLSVSEKGEVMAGRDSVALAESIDEMLSVSENGSENGEAIADSELMVTVEDGQHEFGLA